MPIGTEDISIILCAYTEDRWEAMVAALESLNHQSPPPKEIILVIDHNPQLFKRAVGAFSSIRVVENQYPAGLSGARNTGVSYSRGALLAFMDEDAVAEPDWIGQLVKRYQSPSILGVGGSIIPEWVEGRPAWFPEEFDWVVGCTYRGLPVQPAFVRNLIGCNMSFRRMVFEEVGGFRSGMGRVGTLPLGCEETEFCIRIAHHHPKGGLLFVPDAVVRHQVPTRRTSLKYFLSRCYQEGRSKALVAHFSGTKNGLSSEKSYTLRVLPAGVIRGVADFIRKGDLSGLGKAAAMLLGLACTTVGYLIGIARGVDPTQEGKLNESLTGFTPTQSVEILDEGGKPYGIFHSNKNR